MSSAPDGRTLVDSAHGTGPVDAVYKAINRIVGVPNRLTEFSVVSVTEGSTPRASDRAHRGGGGDR